MPRRTHPLLGGITAAPGAMGHHENQTLPWSMLPSAQQPSSARHRGAGSMLVRLPSPQEAARTRTTSRLTYDAVTARRMAIDHGLMWMQAAIWQGSLGPPDKTRRCPICAVICVETEHADCANQLQGPHGVRLAQNQEMRAM